jgi:hypothetical protein
MKLNTPRVTITRRFLLSGEKSFYWEQFKTDKVVEKVFHICYLTVTLTWALLAVESREARYATNFNEAQKSSRYISNTG